MWCSVGWTAERVRTGTRRFLKPVILYSDLHTTIPRAKHLSPVLMNSFKVTFLKKENAILKTKILFITTSFAITSSKVILLGEKMEAGSLPHPLFFAVAVLFLSPVRCDPLKGRSSVCLGDYYLLPGCLT